MSNFMNSYGLKSYNQVDYDQAHAIIDAMKKNDWSSMNENERNDVRAQSAKYQRS